MFCHIFTGSSSKYPSFILYDLAINNPCQNCNSGLEKKVENKTSVIYWTPLLRVDVIIHPCTIRGTYIITLSEASNPLQWRHNEHGVVSNHQPHDCLPNRVFGRKSKKASKLRVTGLCMGNSPGTGEFPAQSASNAENVSIWWRHHAISFFCLHVQWLISPPGPGRIDINYVIFNDVLCHHVTIIWIQK